MKNSLKVLKYIDPMVDFGFKKIFKESGKKHLIIRPHHSIVIRRLDSFVIRRLDRRIS